MPVPKKARDMLPDHFTRPLTRPYEIWVSRLAGVVLFVIGALLLVGAAGATLAPSTRPLMDLSSVLIYWIVLVPIGAFCCLVGARLA